MRDTGLPKKCDGAATLPGEVYQVACRHLIGSLRSHPQNGDPVCDTLPQAKDTMIGRFYRTPLN